MTAIFFIYGLAFFTLGLAAGLEARRASELALGRQLPWLAAFGFTHSLVEWADMFLLIEASGPAHDGLLIARTLLLPLSALLLVRFGIGLVNTAGPLPEWMSFLPLVLLVPLALLASYAIIVATTQHEAATATDVWSRYLLYLPGNLLAAFGFVRQWRGLPQNGLETARGLLLGAAVMFGFNAFFAGLIVPPAPYGLAPWLNYDTVLSATGVPVQLWRMASAIAVTLFVVRAMGVFEAERANRLKALHAEREQARATAEAWSATLVDINRRIAALEDVDGVLIELVARARALLHADVATLGLWNPERSSLLAKAYALDGRVESGLSIPVRSAWICGHAQGRSARCVHALTREGDTLWRCPILNEHVHAAAIVPLCLDDESLGAIWVARLSRTPFSEVDQRGLIQLADQAVIAIEHAMMTERLQSLAVTEERGRIAREMHDGLAQVLGYLSLEMQTLEAMVHQGSCEATLAELKQARRRINEAQADVRESILSLRTTLAGDIGLAPALRQYVEEFGLQSGIEADLHAEIGGALRLSPLAETQIVRVVQEALTNVRKHAQARHVHVRLAAQDDRLHVCVADDGIGINGQADSGHFGLDTMRERAESIGGSLAISSHAGRGVQIDLWVPMLPRN